MFGELSLADKVVQINKIYPLIVGHAGLKICKAKLYYGRQYYRLALRNYNAKNEYGLKLNADRGHAILKILCGS